MYDVASLHAAVLAFEPRVDPEGFGADDFLLVVGHRPGDIHDVNDGRVGLRVRDAFPGPEAFIVASRDNAGACGIVGTQAQLPLECLLVGALEVPQ